MHIKTKIRIDGTSYYVCYNYNDEQPVIHWVAKTPSGFNRLSELSEGIIARINLHLEILED
jgi:hypothetical protein